MGVAAPVTMAITDATPAAAAAPTRTGALTDIPVTQTLADGSNFVGQLTVTGISLVNGALAATGTLTGTATNGGVVTNVTQSFTNQPLNLVSNGPGNSCKILTLDLGPLHLDVLGLVIDLSEVHLNITAERGPGNLLGNLLCAVAGLLDNGGPLSGVQNLLNQITGLLGGL